MELTPEQKAAAEAEAAKQAEAKAQAEAEARAKADAEILKGLDLPAEKIEMLKGDPDLMAAFKHQIEAKRQANAEAKQHRLANEQFEKAQEEADAKAKAEQGKYQELYEQEKAKNAAQETRLKEVRIEAELKAMATAKGIKKLDYLKMFDKSKLALDDNLNVTGLDEFDTFVKDNPDLFGGEPPESPVTTDQRKPTVTKSKGNLLDELKELKAKAQKTQSSADLAAYNRKFKECKEKKLI